MKITDFPFDRGSPSTKSIEISAHVVEGIVKGWSKPACFVSSLLLRWHTSHSQRYALS